MDKRTLKTLAQDLIRRKTATFDVIRTLAQRHGKRHEDLVKINPEQAQAHFRLHQESLAFCERLAADCVRLRNFEKKIK
jgi:hypothetical protein